MAVLIIWLVVGFVINSGQIVNFQLKMILISLCLGFIATSHALESSSSEDELWNTKAFEEE